MTKVQKFVYGIWMEYDFHISMTGSHNEPGGRPGAVQLCGNSKRWTKISWPYIKGAQNRAAVCKRSVLRLPTV